MSPQRRNRRAGVEDLWRLADGSPSKRDGQGLRWRARWVDPSGKEVTKAFRRKPDAQHHLSNVSAAMVTGQYVPPEGGDVLMGDVLDKFMRGLNVKRSTLQSYTSTVNAQVRPRWGDVPLKAITVSEVRAWLVEMQQGDPTAETKRAQKGLSTGSARKAGRVLSMALEVAVDDKLLARNPMERVQLPREAQPRQGKSLTREQLHGLADAMPTERDRVLTLLLGYTGLRWGEAIGLTVSAVDYQRRRLDVRRTYGEAGGRTYEDTPKSHEARWVPFPPFLGDELRKVSEGKAGGADLFTNSRGNPLLGTNWLPRVLRPALEEAGIADHDDRRIHDLRHTYASLAIQAGANVKQLQRALGHADATITLNTYADLFEDDYAGLGDLLEPPAY